MAVGKCGMEVGAARRGLVGVVLAVFETCGLVNDDDDEEDDGDDVSGLRPVGESIL